MKKTALNLAIASCRMTFGYASAAPSFDADLEMNTDQINADTGGTTFDQNGRVALYVSDTKTSGDNFITATGAVLISTDGTTSVDDSYIQIGNSSIDVQLGSFEAINLFPLGKDTMVEHAGDVTVYQGSLARGRAGDDGGQIAINVTSSDSLSFQINTIYGDDDSDGDDKTAFAGIRPTLTYTTDSVTLSAGFEQVKYKGDTSSSDVNQSGVSVTANFDLGDADINVSYAAFDDDEADQTVTSYSANMTQGDFGIGVIASSEDNATGVDPSVLTTYLAYTFPIFDIDDATITLAGSYSKADDVDTGTNDQTLATRVRVNYTF